MALWNQEQVSWGKTSEDMCDPNLPLEAKTLALGEFLLRTSPAMRLPWSIPPEDGFRSEDKEKGLCSGKGEGKYRCNLSVVS